MYRPALLATLVFAGVSVAAPPLPKPDSVSARVDAALESSWKEQSLTPDASSDDVAFLRRVWLDLAGTVPPPLQARDLLASPTPDWRAKLVESLLASDDFADHWGRVWAQNLTARRPILQDRYDGRVLHAYLRDCFAKNKPYDQLVTELICGEGLSDASGPANFLLRYEGKPSDLAGAVGRQFMGTTLQCAQCHDHPFEKWKKDEFWGVAALFSRVKVFESDDNLHAILEARKGELEVPDPMGKPDENGNPAMKKVAPRLPGVAGPVQGNRRQALAKWLTAPDNPYFARHAINQVWAQLFGQALAPVTDKGGEAPPDGRREVLNMLSDDFTASGYDLQRLIRIIVLSQAYQRASGGETATLDPTTATELHHSKLKMFARFPTRPLSVDQVYRAIVQATGQTGAPEPDPMAKPSEEEEEGENDLPVELLGERALTVQRALTLLNGDYIHQAVQAGAKLAVKVNGPRPGPAHVEWLFLATVSRRPTSEESKEMLELLKTNKDTGGLEDVLWVLLNSAEFNTNH
jgi:hypothetical protein